MGFPIKTRTNVEKKDGSSLSLSCGESVYGGFDTIQRIRNAPTMSDVSIGAVAEFLQGSPQLVTMVNQQGEVQPLLWKVYPGKTPAQTVAHRETEPSKIVKAFRSVVEEYQTTLQYLVYWETCKATSETADDFKTWQKTADKILTVESK